MRRDAPRLADPVYELVYEDGSLYGQYYHKEVAETEQRIVQRDFDIRLKLQPFPGWIDGHNCGRRRRTDQT